MNVYQHAVLLLNADFRVLDVVTIRQGAELLLRDSVVAVTDTLAARLRTPNSHFNVYSILRLKRYIQVPSRKINYSRRAVLKRDRWTCIYCGKSVGDEHQGRRLRHRDFTIDHLIPQSQGGKNTWGNTACACYLCNHSKADRTPNQAGLKLLWEPKRPRVDYLVASGEIPKEWKAYLRLP